MPYGQCIYAGGCLAFAGEHHGEPGWWGYLVAAAFSLLGASSGWLVDQYRAWGKRRVYRKYAEDVTHAAIKKARIQVGDSP